LLVGSAMFWDRRKKKRKSYDDEIDTMFDDIVKEELDMGIC